MLDTNVYDLVVERPGFVERLNRAVVAGAIEILKTRVQDEEIARIPDAARRAKMRSVRSRVVAVSDAAWEGPHPPSADAQIAATARDAAEVLVSEDKDLRERAKAVPSGLVVWRFAELVEFVDALAV